MQDCLVQAPAWGQVLAWLVLVLAWGVQAQVLEAIEEYLQNVNPLPEI